MAKKKWSDLTESQKRAVYVGGANYAAIAENSSSRYFRLPSCSFICISLCKACLTG